MQKTIVFLAVFLFSFSSHATCVGAAPGTCTQQAINQALQNSQMRNQQLFNFTTPQPYNPGQQQYWLDQANRQAQRT